MTTVRAAIRSTAPRDEQPVLPTGLLGRTSRLLALPVRHAARTAAAASRLSSATTEQIATRSAEQVFPTLGRRRQRQPTPGSKTGQLNRDHPGNG
ncbi:MAG: hypothetical protein QOG98_3723 [Pseudonocardiales bacterium]|nr:hypothetical protein [Pseudonocardiales bacterium]